MTKREAKRIAHAAVANQVNSLITADYLLWWEDSPGDQRRVREALEEIEDFHYRAGEK